VLVIIFCVVGCIVLGSKNKEYGMGASMGLFVGVVVGFLLSVVVGFIEIEYYPTYKVTISDEVSMNEFMDKYEILNQDGKIYTVKERTPDVD
jgi:L-cystine uptake protein TcyP (sodium:dicarboxylate symporter family)